MIFKITAWVSISAFLPLFGISVAIRSSVNGIKVCAINTGIWKYNSIIKKKKKKHHKVVLFPNSELNNTELLISKALIDSNVSHDVFVLIKNVLQDFYDIKEGIKNSKMINKLYIKQCRLIV